MWRLLCLCLIAPLALPASEPRPYGQIKAVKVCGEVTAIDAADGEETPLHNGDLLYEGYTLVTGAQASVVLVFSNGSSVRLLPNSRLEISTFRQDLLEADELAPGGLPAEPGSSETRLRLEYGETLHTVQKLRTDRGSSYEVATPVGAAGIRGTEFLTSFREDGDGPQRFSFATHEGRVVVTGPDGELGVPAGRMLAGRLRTGMTLRLARARTREIGPGARRLLEHNHQVIRQLLPKVRFTRKDGAPARGGRPKLRRDPAQQREKDNDLRDFAKDNPDWEHYTHPHPPAVRPKPPKSPRK
jgi:hypothetical protein